MATKNALKVIGTLAAAALALAACGTTSGGETAKVAILWTAGVRTVLTSNPGDFQIFGFHTLRPS